MASRTETLSPFYDTLNQLLHLLGAGKKNTSVYLQDLARARQVKHRAGGGPVLAGQPYIVGERRPELFVPDRKGRIEPRVRSVLDITINVEGCNHPDHHKELANIVRKVWSDQIANY